MNAISLHRLGSALYRRGHTRAARVVEFVIFLLFNSVIPSSASIGAGTVFAYGGIGVVLHKRTVIGSGCLIGQGVTIGSKEAFSSTFETRCPTVADNVYLAAGCRLLGDIVVGPDAVVAANAVVTKNVEQGSIVGGIPAREIGRTESGYLAIRSSEG